MFEAVVLNFTVGDAIVGLEYPEKQTQYYFDNDIKMGRIKLQNLAYFNVQTAYK